MTLPTDSFDFLQDVVALTFFDFVARLLDKKSEKVDEESSQEELPKLRSCCRGWFAFVVKLATEEVQGE